MKKYAEKTCYDCGMIKPANQMTKLSFNELRGSVSGQMNYWTSKPDRAFVHTGGWAEQQARKVSGDSYQSGREFYVTKHEWFCDECLEGRKSLLTSTKGSAIIATIIVLVTITTLAFII